MNVQGNWGMSSRVKRCLRINGSPKLMALFFFTKGYVIACADTICCGLFLWIAKMEISNFSRSEAVP